MAVRAGRVGLLLALALAAPLVGPLVGALSAAAGTQTVSNETLSAAPGTYQELSGYDVNRSSATVVANGTTLSAPADYHLNTSDGALRLNESAVDAGDTVSVSYAYQASDPLTTRLLNIVPILVGVLLVGLIGIGLEEVP